MDYNAPASGEHQLFNEPFYMSDPIGYVNADGTVVLYSWVKQYIANDKYHAPKMEVLHNRQNLMKENRAIRLTGKLNSRYRPSG